MKTNDRRTYKVRDGKKEELERREENIKALKAARKEKHKSKNQRPHQYSRYFFADDEDL